MKHYLLFTICSLITFNLFSQNNSLQETNFYDKTWNFSSEKNATYKVVKEAVLGSFVDKKNQSTHPSAWKETVYNINGNIMSTGEFLLGYYNGDWKRYYTNGQLKSNTKYNKGTYIDQITYYENGVIEYKDHKYFYKSGALEKETKTKGKTTIDFHYFEEGSIERKVYFLNDDEIADTSFFEDGVVEEISFFQDGEVLKTINYFNSKEIKKTKTINGDSVLYKEFKIDGTLCYERLIVNKEDVYVKGNCEEEVNLIDSVYLGVEKMPRFKNCEEVDIKEVKSCTDAQILQFIIKNVTYPQYAIENDMQAKEYIRFVVDKEGNVTNVSSAKGSNSILTEEAIRTISSFPQFTPGYQRGKSVKVQYVIPVNFKLS